MEFVGEEGLEVLGGGFLAAESSAASGAQPAEKSFPWDPALVLSTGKLYKLNTLLFS